MARYIDADVLREKIQEIKGRMDFYTGTACFLAVLESPTADVEEVRHGTWIWAENGEEDYEQYWICSVCGEKEYFKTNYCSDCGAKMDGGKANDLL